MSKKKQPLPNIGQVVQGEILPTMEIDCSSWIKGTPAEEWTRGPVRPVNGQEPPTQKKRKKRQGRDK